MPLEIRELVIKAVIHENKANSQGAMDRVKLTQLKKEISAYCLERLEEKMKQALER